MFRKHKEHKRRGSFFLFAVFRFLLSLVIFGLLLGGLYAAFQSFSGINPLKIDPKTVLMSLLSDYPQAQELVNQILPSGSGLDSNIFENVPVIVNRGEIGNISKKELFSFMLVSDSHNENGYLRKALEQARVRGSLRFIIGLGDYTEVGAEEDLRAAKSEFDSTGIRYFLTAGDHDLWDNRNKNQVAELNFTKIFGKPYQSFAIDNVKFLILYNSDNYLGVDSAQMKWLQQETEKIKNEPKGLVLAFMHEPLYHPSSDHVMGKTAIEVKNQVKNIAKVLKDAGVQEIFAGDVHYFTRYMDPENNISMTTVGAVASQRNTQLPRYSIVTIFEDHSLGVEDIEIRTP